MRKKSKRLGISSTIKQFANDLKCLKLAGDNIIKKMDELELKQLNIEKKIFSDEEREIILDFTVEAKKHFLVTCKIIKYIISGLSIIASGIAFLIYLVVKYLHQLNML